MTKEECARVINVEVDLTVTIHIKDSHQGLLEHIQDKDRIYRNYELAIIEDLVDDFNQVEIVALDITTTIKEPKPKLGKIGMEVEV